MAKTILDFISVSVLSKPSGGAVVPQGNQLQCGVPQDNQLQYCHTSAFYVRSSSVICDLALKSCWCLQIFRNLPLILIKNARF